MKGAAGAAAWAAALAAIALQIAYPLVGESGQRRLTVASVAFFALASLLHAWTAGGRTTVAALAVIAIGGGWLAEALGSKTGFPFGRYTYADSLGAELWGVPAVVPLAWAMMAWPALLAGRRAGRPVLVGAAILVTWDLFLDPQMVGDGHWRWAPSGWPDLHGIPISNTLGWILVSVLMMGALDRAVPDRVVLHLGVPALLLAWTWFSETIGHLFFFDRPSVALVGGAAMGLALWPAVRSFQKERVVAR